MLSYVLQDSSMVTCALKFATEVKLQSNLYIIILTIQPFYHRYMDNLSDDHKLQNLQYGGSGLRLNDGPDVKFKSVNWCLMLVLGWAVRSST